MTAFLFGAVVGGLVIHAIWLLIFRQMIKESGS